MTVAEFLEWAGADQSSTRWQLCDGEPEMMAPASERHGRIQGRAEQPSVGMHLRTIGTVTAASSSLPASIPRIRSAENFRIPDIGITCAR